MGDAHILFPEASAIFQCSTSLKGEKKKGGGGSEIFLFSLLPLGLMLHTLGLSQKPLMCKWNECTGRTLHNCFV